MDTLCLNAGMPAAGGGASSVGRSTSEKAAAPPQKRWPFGFSFKYPLTPFWSGGGVKYRRRSGLALDDAVLMDSGDSRKPIVEHKDKDEAMASVEAEGQNGNWALRILHVPSLWKNNGEAAELEEEQKGTDDTFSRVDDDGCDVCTVEEDDDDDEKKFQFDRESFSRLLKRVSLTEAKLYAQLSNLGCLAYSVSKIKPANLLKYHGMRFVTSSAEKREVALKTEKMEVLAETQEEEEEEGEGKEQENTGYRISAASAAFEIAVSAASYLQSHTKSMLPFKSSNSEISTSGGENAASFGNMDLLDPDVASLVAAEEDVKQAVADDLQSSHSSPCDWFICDDDHSHSRFFVIQGSESLASWQANLLFEPIEFEGFDVLVHRGIYEAAKGMYEQMLPQVRAHFKSHGDRAKFRFTGHSLGGSLSLLLNLMLLIRGEVPASSLLPVVTFGAPFVMCGGDRLLGKLGLPQSHVQAVTMHRDIVPRAFSCSYPENVAKLLKAVNGSFRSHPCLDKQNVLYVPMGKLLILQPDEKFSPQHDLLPTGSGLYVLTAAFSDIDETEKRLRAAQAIYLNSPHPLEILGDRSAYGSGGTIQRDHDMSSYLKSVRSVIKREVNHARKAKREQRRGRSLWWSTLVARERATSRQMNGHDFSGRVKSGRESMRRFSRLVASQHMHQIVVLLFPVKLMVLGAYDVFSFP